MEVALPGHIRFQEDNLFGSDHEPEEGGFSIVRYKVVDGDFRFVFFARRHHRPSGKGIARNARCRHNSCNGGDEGHFLGTDAGAFVALGKVETAGFEREGREGALRRRVRIDGQPRREIDTKRFDVSVFTRFFDREDWNFDPRRFDFPFAAFFVLDDVLREADRRMATGGFEESTRRLRAALDPRCRFIGYTRPRLKTVCIGRRVVLRFDDFRRIGLRQDGHSEQSSETKKQ